MLVAGEDVLPRQGGHTRRDIPVASTSCVGCNVIRSPLRSTSTVRLALSSKDADRQAVFDQYGTSMTLV
jgi:hypothetical protein